MTIEVNETKKKQVEVELPYYIKNGCHYYKLISTEESVGVRWSEHILNHTAIELCSSTLPFGGEFQEITKEKFNQAFNEAMAYLLEKNKDNNNPCEEPNFCAPQDSDKH